MLPFFTSLFMPCMCMCVYIRPCTHDTGICNVAYNKKKVSLSKTNKQREGNEKKYEGRGKGGQSPLEAEGSWNFKKSNLRWRWTEKLD